MCESTVVVNILPAVLYSALTSSTSSLQVHNVSFSFELMQDGGLERPKPRPEGKGCPTHTPCPFIFTFTFHVKAEM